MRERVIQPARNIEGKLRMPGDKSICHRYALLAALAEGPSRFHNFSTGADCARTLSCLHGLGVMIEHDTAQHIVGLQGRSGALEQPHAPLDCGNSGSTMRMLAGILAGQPLACELVGDGSLARRPMRRVIEPLRRMGAQITSSSTETAPLMIRGGGLKAIAHKTEVASAQVKSAVLFAGLQTAGETTVEEPLRTRDHGELALRAFGAELERGRNRIKIRGGQRLRGFESMVPGDASSASFFLCAAALFPESNLVLEGVLMNPTRSSLLDLLAGMGARVKVIDLEEQRGELLGSIKVQANGMTGARIAGGQAAALIDELPVLAAIAPFTRDGIEIRDARELRVKESDRIALIASNLRAMGARCDEREDGLSIPGGQELHGAEIDSAGDHRIAMAFAIAALKAKGESVIADADAAAVSFPEFYELLDVVVER